MLLEVNGVVRLARDVEIRYSQSGSAIANFSVVSSKKYKTQSGEQKEETTFIDCTAFSRLAEICNQYLKKGDQVFIRGDLKLDNWTAQDGTKRSKHSINVTSLEMLGGKNETSRNTTPQQAPQQPAAQQPTQSVPEIDMDDDSIPF